MPRRKEHDGWARRQLRFKVSVWEWTFVGNDGMGRSVGRGFRFGAWTNVGSV